MLNLAVVGAGHAGVEAAFALAKHPCAVTLYSDEAVLPYFRPRLIAVAFGEVSPNDISIKPATAYQDAPIHLAFEPVTHVDITRRTVDQRPYDGIILAQGARPFVPIFSGCGAGRVRTLWSMHEALALHDALKSGAKTLVIIGGGVLGLEAAYRAAKHGLQVTLLEVAPTLLGGRLGTHGEARFRATLAEKGITLKCGVSITDITASALSLSDGETLPADLILCATGARPNLSLMPQTALSCAESVTVRPDLSLAPRIYAAGDIATLSQHRPTCSVRRAQLMGQCAAQNLLAEIEGDTPTPWTEPTLPLSMKIDDMEFYTQGDVTSPDLTEVPLADTTENNAWRSVLYREDRPVGLRWVGTRKAFAEWSKQLSLQ